MPWGANSAGCCRLTDHAPPVTAPDRESCAADGPGPSMVPDWLGEALPVGCGYRSSIFDRAPRTTASPNKQSPNKPRMGHRPAGMTAAGRG